MQHINKNLPLVHFIARKYYNNKRCQVRYEDLVQEGVFGLIEAEKRYNHSRGSYSTYASFWIRKYMSAAIVQQANTVRIPAHKFYTMNHIYQTIDEATYSNVQYNDEKDMNEFKELTYMYLQSLNPRERNMIMLKCGFFDGRVYTNAEIGELYGLSRETVRYRNQKTIKKLQVIHKASNLL